MTILNNMNSRYKRRTSSNKKQDSLKLVGGGVAISQSQDISQDNVKYLKRSSHFLSDLYHSITDIRSSDHYKRGIHKLHNLLLSLDNNLRSCAIRALSKKLTEKDYAIILKNLKLNKEPIKSLLILKQLGYSFARMNLSDLNLTGLHFPFANLNYACLKNSDLRFSTLIQSSFVNSDLSNCNLLKANFGPRPALIDSKQYTSMAAISPDNRYLAAANTSGEIRVWDIETNEIYIDIDIHKNKVNSLLFSNDSKWVISSDQDSIIYVWNFTENVLEYQLKGQANGLNFIDVSPDSSQLVYSTRNSKEYKIKIYEFQTHRIQKLMSAVNFCVDSLKHSPDGLLIGLVRRFVDSDAEKQLIWYGEIVLIELSTIQKKFRTTGSTFKEAAIAFSPEGSYLATSNFYYTINIYEINSGSLIRSLEGHSNAITKISFMTSRIISSSIDNVIKIWTENECISTIKHHTKTKDVYESTFCVSPDEKLLAVNGNMYELGCIEHIFKRRILKYVTVSDCSSYIIAIDSDNDIILMEIMSDKVIGRIRPNTAFMVALSPNTEFIVSANTNDTISVWKYEYSVYVLQYTLQLEVMNTTALIVTNDFIVSSKTLSTVAVWDIRTGMMSKKLKGHFGVVSELRLSNCKNFVIGVDGLNRILVWNLDKEIIEKSVNVDSKHLVCKSLSHDGSFLAALYDFGRVREINIIEETSYEFLVPFPSWFDFIVYTAEHDKIILVGNQVAVWNKKYLKSIIGEYFGPLASLSISKNGRYKIAIDCEGNISIWS